VGKTAREGRGGQNKGGITIKVGIPRALFYYYHYPLWEGFFRGIGMEVIPSPPTNKAILNSGIGAAVDEACLPVKIFYGHVMALIDRVDCLFLPRLVSVERKAYICPKLMGLPDMIAAGVTGLPRVLSPCVDLSRRGRSVGDALEPVGYQLGKSAREIKRAVKLGLAEQRRFEDLVSQGYLPVEALDMMAGHHVPEPPGAGIKVAVVGHSYNLFDSHISMNLVQKLRSMGAVVVTTDQIPEEVVEEEASRLPKRMFWTLGKRMLGGTFHFLSRTDIKGIIHLASFGCGPDSLVGELLERHARRQRGTPFMLLTIDEHTGEAGVVTRLEAFLDMIERRHRNEDHVSAHG